MVLNYIWIAFFLIAFVVAVVRLVFLGDTEVFPAIINSTFSSSKTAFEISPYACMGVPEFIAEAYSWLIEGKELPQEAENGEVVIKYTIIKEEGPDHDKMFTAEVECDGKKLASGMGRSKKAAEMEAARQALKNY